MNDWAAILTHDDQKPHLLAQAPTGLGKTLAALVPALAWVAEAPQRRRVYYLVNRLTQHDNPLRELKADLGPIFETQTKEPLRVVDIVGRRWLCPHADKRHLPPLCENSRKTAHFALLPEGIASWQEVKAHLDEEPPRTYCTRG
jgi:Rad3-related DNA helicase